MNPARPPTPRTPARERRWPSPTSTYDSPDGAADDEGDRDPQRGDEDRHRDVAAFELVRKVDFGRELVDDAIAHVHQHDADGRVQQIQPQNPKLHGAHLIDDVERGGPRVTTNEDARGGRTVSVRPAGVRTGKQRRVERHAAYERGESLAAANRVELIVAQRAEGRPTLVRVGRSLEMGERVRRVADAEIRHGRRQAAEPDGR